MNAGAEKQKKHRGGNKFIWDFLSNNLQKNNHNYNNRLFLQ